ncbi:MAG: hypothetical protein J0H71_20900 [Rhizobiales bacterium]|nr:hypothetical protein [Hyphomicrobiales bacterium]
MEAATDGLTLKAMRGFQAVEEHLKIVAGMQVKAREAANHDGRKCGRFIPVSAITSN